MTTGDHTKAVNQIRQVSDSDVLYSHLHIIHHPPQGEIALTNLHYIMFPVM